MQRDLARAPVRSDRPGRAAATSGHPAPCTGRPAGVPRRGRTLITTHLQQICEGGDAFEKGSARPLDYGHWSAHKLESITNHAVSHGEAVAIGMCLDALYAVEVGLLAQMDAENIIEVVSDLGFSIWHTGLLQNDDQGNSELLLGLEEFRQHLGGELCITLLRGLGNAVEVHQIDKTAMLAARDRLKTYAEKCQSL